jgi:hypothetical protein
VRFLVIATTGLLAVLMSHGAETAFELVPSVLMCSLAASIMVVLGRELPSAPQTQLTGALSRVGGGVR